MCKYCLDAIKDTPELITGEAWNSPFREYCGGYVYFFATEDLSRIKIGFTRHDPAIRMKYYQSEETQKLIMIAVYPVPSMKIEKNLHKFFSPLRINKNREWFLWQGRMCPLLKEMWLVFFCGMGCDEVDAAWGYKINHI